jgi:hypothetical protein
MGFAQDALSAMNVTKSVRSIFSASILYLEDKDDFMKTVQHFTFTSDSRVAKYLQINLLKQAFTAIGFGARASSKSWVDPSGQWSGGALVSIIQNAQERQRFLADATVKKFIAEQHALDEYIYAVETKFNPTLLSDPHLQTDSGRVSKSKVLAYLYQHAETAVMNIVRSVAAQHYHFPIANVHDAIFFKKRLGVDLKHEIELAMREQTGNPYWSLKPEPLKRYTPKSFDEEIEQTAHKARIIEEEKKAKQKYAASGIKDQTIV